MLMQLGFPPICHVLFLFAVGSAKIFTSSTLRACCTLWFGQKAVSACFERDANGQSLLGLQAWRFQEPGARSLCPLIQSHRESCSD